MRRAIFSDVHSNLEAYEAVLAALKTENIDKYYCAGDIVGYGAEPSACINITKELNPAIVAGNHDWGAVGLANLNNFTENAKAAVLWTAGALTQEDKTYLSALKPVDRNDFMIVHGSPNRPEEFEYILGPHEAYAAFLAMQENQTQICFIGHTHVAGVFAEERGYITYNSWPETKLSEHKKYIINVGSVGQPRDNDPHAAYCIYDTEKKMIEIKRVIYDIKKAQEKIIKAGLPRILAERLSVGR